VRVTSGIQSGIVLERKCTDLMFGITLLIMVVCMIGMSFYGYKKGNYLKLMAGIASDGN